MQSPRASQSGQPNLTGTWEFIVDVTAASGRCAGEEKEVPKPDTIKIVKTGTKLVVRGFGLTENDAWDGAATGGNVTFAGKRAEDGGITTAEFRLTLVGATAMHGDEQWSWAGATGSCPNGRSDVTARRTRN